jgi:hypothetical protein
MGENQSNVTNTLTKEDIANCISVLELLVSETDHIFDIEKEQRIALIKAAGQFSRPNREEFSKSGQKKTRGQG